MGNVHVGGPRRSLARYRLRRLHKDIMHFLIEVEHAEYINPQRIGHLRRNVVVALSMIELELRADEESYSSMRITYDRVTLLYGVAKVSLLQIRHDMYVERHGPRAGVL